MNRKRIISISTFLLLASLVCIAIAFANKNSKSNKMIRPTLIDFKAVADLEDTISDFSQVILRMELLNTHADILKHDISTPQEHQKRINYYITDFKKDIFLISKSDTIPCYDAHAERLYMDLPYMNFILTFNHKISVQDEILIQDIVYSNNAVIITIDPKKQKL